MVLQSILVEQSNWQQAFAALQLSTLTPHSLIVSFGHERSVPLSLMRKVGPRVIQAADLCLDSNPLPPNSLHGCTSNDAIAVVGPSCMLPGATDLSAFWDILCAGK